MRESYSFFLDLTADTTSTLISAEILCLDPDPQGHALDSFLRGIREDLNLLEKAFGIKAETGGRALHHILEPVTSHFAYQSFSRPRGKLTHQALLELATFLITQGGWSAPVAVQTIASYTDHYCVPEGTALSFRMLANWGHRREIGLRSDTEQKYDEAFDRLAEAVDTAGATT